jgi:hypothetical protein
MFLFSTRQTQHRFMPLKTGATQLMSLVQFMSPTFSPLSFCSQWDMNYNCVFPSIHPLAGEGYHLRVVTVPDTSSGVRHVLSRQPCGRRALCVQLDLMCGDFGSHHALKIEVSVDGSRCDYDATSELFHETRYSKPSIIRINGRDRNQD